MSLLIRLLNVFRVNRLSHELDEELAFHVAERIDDLVAAGFTEKDARKEALRCFGNYTVQKERTRDMDIAGWLEGVTNDLRHGARQLRLNPGFTAVAVLSLALGIGANTAIFQLINAIRLRSLPVHEPERLVAIDEDGDFLTAGWYSSRHRAFTYAQFDEIRKRQQAFSGVFAFGTERFNLSRGGEARYSEGLYVSSGFLDVLGVQPIAGRGFTTEDDRLDCASGGALLNFGFWQREYAGDLAAVGKTIYLSGHTFPIIGITPAEFFGIEPGKRFDVALPLCADSALNPGGGRGNRLQLRDAWWLTPIARLKPGWTLEQASSHMRDLSPTIFRETLPERYRPDFAAKYLKNRFKVISASTGISSLRRQYANPLWILLAVAGLVLLIACANLANLLLARASARERELAIRQALGASRSRLLGQLLAESMLLAGLGGIFGAILAQGLSRALVAFLNNGRDQLELSLGVDWNVFGFTALLALITCLLFGLAPAIRATDRAPATAMHGGRGSTASPERNGLRRTLVVSQIAISLVLLVGAFLFGRSLQNLLTVETGISAQGVLVARVDATVKDLKPEHRTVVFQQLQDRIAALPGVSSAAPVFIPPFSGAGWNNNVHAEGDTNATGGQEVWFNRVGPDYFQTLRTTIISGRDFGTHDDLKAPQVAIVNEQFAKTLFGGANPIGHTFRQEGSVGEADPVFEIVGVVKNTKYAGLREETRSIAFLPMAQDKEPQSAVTFVVRSQAPISGLMGGIRRVMAELQPGLLVEFRVLDLQVQQSVLRERLMANLSGGFGVLAALLSTLGLYGVMSYMVARRRNEIGVRMALGAQPRDVLRLIFGEAGRLYLIGVVLGLAGSFGLSRYAESLLYGLKPNDPMTLVAGCVLLGVTALLAALAPARLAAKLDPAVVLRDE